MAVDCGGGSGSGGGVVDDAASQAKTVRILKRKSKPFGVFSLTENTQRYKSLAGFAIFLSRSDICYASDMLLHKSPAAICQKRKGFISYRIERGEIYRNQVKQGYIAFA